MPQSKRRFTHAERYAIWHCNGERCYLCHVPLLLIDVTVDHVLPESLLRDDVRRAAVLAEYGLPQTFDINGYENWLPCHHQCNTRKSAKPPTFCPGNKAILDRLAANADKVARFAKSVISDSTKDHVFSTVFVALENRKISLIDLQDLLRGFGNNPSAAGIPDDTIVLDSGYWFKHDEIVSEGLCRCERQQCVGMNSKAYCYFEKSLSNWVVTCGLFWRCYDDLILCTRCSGRHKRGHIGREGICGRPYLDQQNQRD